MDQRRKQSLHKLEAELKANTTSTLGLGDYLAAVYDYHKATYQKPEDNTNLQGNKSPLFEFCRLTKGHPDVRKLSGKEALDLVEGWMRKYPPIELEGND